MKHYVWIWLAKGEGIDFKTWLCNYS